MEYYEFSKDYMGMLLIAVEVIAVVGLLWFSRKK